MGARMLGQYELRELLGSGGMGAVYRGYQAALKREVAVKVLAQQLAEQTGYLERFIREAEIAAALEHAHIVPIYDYGTQQGVNYIVMRLLTGGSLTQRLRWRAENHEPLPSLREIADLLSQLASALDYAHSKGVIHRDVKPNNVMFDAQGSAYLVDLGIAKLSAATHALTATGTTMGTPSYMAPEQWRAEEPIPATDQYALGAMIYELIIGRPPFEAPTPFGLMHKHLNEKVTPPQVERPEVPDEVNQVIERAMAKQAGDRFSSCAAFAEAFSSAVQSHKSAATTFFRAPLPPPTANVTAVTLPPDGPFPYAAPAYTPVAQQPPAWGGQAPTPPYQPPPWEQPLPLRKGKSRAWLGIGVVLVVLIGIAAVIAVLLASGGDDKSSGSDVVSRGIIETDEATEPPATDTMIPATSTATDTAIPATSTDTATASPTIQIGKTASKTATVTATITLTNTATKTATKTATQVPTETPTKTATITLTNTATPLPSKTPVPPTYTATADDTATYAAVATAVVQTFEAAQSKTPLVPTITPITPTKPPTVTSTATKPPTKVPTRKPPTITPVPYLHVGGRAVVYVEDEGLKLRAGAGTGYTIIENMPRGTIVTLVGDPVDAEGYRWWMVQSPNGNIGWSVQAADNIETLVPLPD